MTIIYLTLDDDCHRHPKIRIKICDDVGFPLPLFSRITDINKLTQKERNILRVST
jgi:hypothetical protein